MVTITPKPQTPSKSIIYVFDSLYCWPDFLLYLPRFFEVLVPPLRTMSLSDIFLCIQWCAQDRALRAIFFTFASHINLRNQIGCIWYSEPMPFAFGYGNIASDILDNRILRVYLINATFLNPENPNQLNPKTPLKNLNIIWCINRTNIFALTFANFYLNLSF